MTRARLAARLALAGWALLAAACASLPPENPPLASYAPESGYRFERLERGDNSDELFVIVTFSGGGTRAAALAYGVLEALRDTTIEWQGRRRALLDEVDVISSISGGSFPAAYYALRGRRIFDEFPDRFLYRPIQTSLVRLALWPGNWLKLAAPSYGRSDLAAEFYDREVFGGATYADVIARNRRPFVVLNATDMTTGTQFPFIQDQFDLMCSDLAGVSLARAAASSSAFPGGLTALTFRNYAGSCQYRQPAWVALAAADHAARVNPRRSARAENRLSLAADGPARPYIHLTDGGVADNIGLRGPLEAIASTNHPWSVLRLMNRQRVSRLVVIVVNAATNPATGRDRSAAVPGLIDTLSTAATVPLDNYSFDTVELLRSTVSEFDTGARLVEGCNRLSAGKGAQCALELPVPHKVELYPVQVAFEYIGSREERAWFKNLPTSFELPRETIDKLRALGRRLLAEDPQFQNLLKALNGCLAGGATTC
ncbi:MAG: patatin-like phospholipase family protein [Betaproteobacteria bacterium]|nr:MAG: patatin-like phospholipase family protein [Betaproteobacteria bacterium]